MDLAAVVLLAPLLPILAVESASECPDASVLVADLDLQLDAIGRPGAASGAEGQYRLQVEERPSDVLHVELLDAQGIVVLVRDLSVGDASCAARSRSVAVMVERWLAALPALPVGIARRSPHLRQAAVRAPRARPAEPRPTPTPEPAGEVHAGPTFGLHTGSVGLSAGLTVGGGVRLAPWFGTWLDVFASLPVQSAFPGGSATIWLVDLRLRADLRSRLGWLGLAAGPTVHAAAVSVSTRGLAKDDSTSRLLPSAGLAVAASAPLGRHASVAVALEPWLALDGQLYYVTNALGRHVVYRTPSVGLRLDLLVDYDLF